MSRAGERQRAVLELVPTELPDQMGIQHEITSTREIGAGWPIEEQVGPA